MMGCWWIGEGGLEVAGDDETDCWRDKLGVRSGLKLSTSEMMINNHKSSRFWGQEVPGAINATKCNLSGTLMPLNRDATTHRSQVS